MGFSDGPGEQSELLLDDEPERGDDAKRNQAPENLPPVEGGMSSRRRGNLVPLRKLGAVEPASSRSMASQ